MQEHERRLDPYLAEAGAVAQKYLAYLHTRCAETEGRIFVAEDEGRVVGFVSVWARVKSRQIEEVEHEYAYISDLVVLSSHRRRGAGRALLTRAEQYAVSRGATRLRLGVLAKNDSARALYWRQGFEERLLELEKNLARGDERGAAEEFSPADQQPAVEENSRRDGPKLVVIFGPPAVGKMTVGRELAQLTGLKLFHNHMSIELALNFFKFGEPGFYSLLSKLRRFVFEEMAASHLPGLIFTYVWGFDLPSERPYVESVCDIFRARGGQIYFVELEADLEERLRRNETEARLAEKPSKRDVEESRARLLEDEAKHRMNSEGEFGGAENYIRINNTHLAPDECARRIVEAFGL